MAYTAQHIEQPRREFEVEFKESIYTGTPRSETRKVLVSAETETGAVRVASYHHGARGYDFRIKETVN